MYVEKIALDDVQCAIEVEAHAGFVPRYVYPRPNKPRKEPSWIGVPTAEKFGPWMPTKWRMYGRNAFKQGWRKVADMAIDVARFFPEVVAQHVSHM